MAQTENVTILFTDLVGSTELASSLVPEAADSLRRAHFSALRKAVAATGGTEVKNLGDGIMVVFPSGSAALACAVAMQQAVDRENRTGDHSLGLRVGLSTGEASREGDDYFGDPVVESARLCAEARGGQILTTEFVRMMAGRRIAHTLHSLGEMQLKGLVEPIEVLEVSWDPLPDAEAETGTSQIPLPTRLAIAPAVGMIGRQRELDHLAHALKSAAAGDGRGVVLISGDPGVGKTALAAHAARLAHEAGACVLLGRCDEDLAVPYGPFAEALHHYVASAPDEVLASHVQTYGAELARMVPALGKRLGELPVRQSSDPDTERYLLLGAAVGLLSQVAQSQVVVLVLDDLQWADKGSLQLLRLLVTSDDAIRLLVIGTYRRSELTDAHPLTSALVTLRREPRVSEIDLTGLDDAGVVAFLEAAAGHELAEPGHELALALYRETEGNPYFVGEVLAHLYETGVIFRTESGRWQAREDLERWTLPESVVQVVASRVARLGEGARRALSLASVIGREFDLDLLAAVSDRSEDELLDILDGASSAALVREVHERAGCYTFSHALVQHTLYQELGATRRARVHRSVAEAIEAACHGVPGRRVAELAYHWSNATRPVELAKAVSYGLQAGTAALEALAPDEAVRHFSQALALLEDDTDPDASLRMDLLLGLGTAQRQAGSSDYRETFLDAARRARELSDTDRLVSAALGNNRGLVSSALEIDTERISVLEAALAALPASDSRERALLLATLCTELTFGSSLDRRVELADEALSMARRLGHAETTVVVADLVQTPLSVPRMHQQRLGISIEVLELAESLADPGLLLRALTVRRKTAIQGGDFELAASCLGRARRLTERLREPTYLWIHAVNEATEALMVGEPDRADGLAERALRIGMDTGQPDAIPFYGGQLASIRLQQGRLGELVPLIERSLDEHPDTPAYRAILVMAILEEGDETRARALLEEAAGDQFASVPEDATWVDTMGPYAYAAIELRDVRAAQVLLDLLAPYGGQVANEQPTTSSGPIANPLGGLATVLGRHDEAESYLTYAAQLCARGDLRFAEARGHLAFGRMYKARGRQGDVERAREHLALGAPPIRRAWLRETGAVGGGRACRLAGSLSADRSGLRLVRGHHRLDVGLRPCDQHVFEVPQAGHLADPLPARVVDADLRPHVALGVERQRVHVATHGAPRRELIERDPGLVVVRQHQHAGPHPADGLPQGLGHLSPAIERALVGRVARVDPLARLPVVVGVVPGHQRLPDVVVGEVAVLVVGRVEVGQVELAQRLDHFGRIGPDGPPGTRQELGRTKLQAVVGAGSPAFHVGHLQSRRRVDAIRGVDEAGEQDGIEVASSEVRLDPIPDGIHPLAVEGLEEPGPDAERLGEVPRLPG